MGLFHWRRVTLVTRIVVVVVASLAISAREARATPMAWELVGVGQLRGVITDYVSPDTPITLRLLGDTDEAPIIPSWCPSDSHAARWHLYAELAIGDFTWRSGGTLERLNERGICGFVPLSFSSFGGWAFDGIPPDPLLRDLLGGRFVPTVFARFSPGDPDATTLGEQLDEATSGYGFVNSDGVFGSFSGNLTPTPEPASFVLLGGGLALLAARRRRRTDDAGSKPPAPAGTRALRASVPPRHRGSRHGQIGPRETLCGEAACSSPGINSAAI